MTTKFVPSFSVATLYGPYELQLWRLQPENDDEPFKWVVNANGKEFLVNEQCERDFPRDPDTWGYDGSILPRRFPNFGELSGDEGKALYKTALQEWQTAVLAGKYNR